MPLDLPGRRHTKSDGFIYVVTNPAWPGIVKIGSAINPEVRLRGYQTCDPHRAYELRGFAYYPDRNLAESRVHERLNDCRVGGEWFRMSVSDALRAIANIPIEEV